MPRAKPPNLRPQLDQLYTRYNHRHFVDPDPLAAVYAYDDAANQEIVGLIAASLAFGGVKQILASIRTALSILGPPDAALGNLDPQTLRLRYAGFRHRYVTGEQLAAMLAGVQRVRRAHGSLGAAFEAQQRAGDETVLPALTRFAALLHEGEKNYLVPDPARGSACKRWLLYLRWMVRSDGVDLGIWKGVNASKLVVPMDTHMHRIALRLGLTRRRTADMRAALETTAAFRKIRPDDPVRYDFALTRLGIRQELDPERFYASCLPGLDSQLEDVAVTR